jgi:hypothetical protein
MPVLGDRTGDLGFFVMVYWAESTKRLVRDIAAL